MRKDVRPPNDESRDLRPIRLRRPLRIKNVHRVPGAADRFALGAAVVLEVVDGDYIPRICIFGQHLQPDDIMFTAFEPITKMLNAVDIRFILRQSRDAVRKLRREVVVEKEVQAARRCSNPTAAFTMAGLMP